MPSSRFRMSQALLIDADGAIAPLPFRAPLFGGGLVVLARERCLFSRLDTPRGTSSASAVRAARLNAEVGAPYALSGSAIARQGQQFGIWWWDAQWVADRLAEAGLDPAIKVVPEPFVRAAGEGWRIVRRDVVWHMMMGDISVLGEG